MRLLLVTLLTLLVIPAYGSIIVVSGVTNLSTPPASLLAGALVSDSTIYGFAEQQGVVLSAPLNVGITSPGAWVCCSGFTSAGTLPAGETVNSYLLYASPVTSQGDQFFRQFVGQISFSPGEKIVGIIIGKDNIAATDAMFGAPGTVYPPLADQLGGLEPNDGVDVSNNMSQVFVRFNVVVGGEDMIRILTATPEPADFLLIGSGLLALAFFGGKLRLGRASTR